MPLPTIDALYNAWEPLFRESDRGVTLITVAALDEALGGLHLRHIATHVKSPERTYKLLSRPFAPLSSFSSKAQLAYSYGLIDDVLYRQLEIMRKIRNAAAHTAGKFKFDDKKIKELTFTLNRVEIDARIKQGVPAAEGAHELTTELFKRMGIKVLAGGKNESPRWHFIITGMSMEALIKAKPY